MPEFHETHLSDLPPWSISLDFLHCLKDSRFNISTSWYTYLKRIVEEEPLSGHDSLRLTSGKLVLLAMPSQENAQRMKHWCEGVPVPTNQQIVVEDKA